jgi:hypothetical protein
MEHRNGGPHHVAALTVSTTRDHALDALRTIAVIGMMAAHTARLMPRDIRPDWATLVLLIEPVIPTLFLLLVGLSLARSFSAAMLRGMTAGAWYVRQIKRAAALWVVSAVFFTAEMGFRLPDVFLAGGILANIAYAIVLVGGLLALGGTRGARPLLGAVLIVASSIFVWLDMNALRVHPVNIGNSPFLPLWLFALAGAFGSVFFQPRVSSKPTQPPRGPGNAALILTAVGAAVAVGLIARYGLQTLFTQPFGRSDATRLIPPPIYGGEALSIAYYNLRPVLAAACLGLQVAVLGVAGYALRVVKESAASWVFALGRHALTAYILHLALLAIIVVASGERQPLKTGMLGTVVWFGLIVICQGVAMVLVRRNKVRR